MRNIDKHLNTKYVLKEIIGIMTNIQIMMTEKVLNEIKLQNERKYKTID